MPVWIALRCPYNRGQTSENESTMNKRAAPVAKSDGTVRLGQSTDPRAIRTRKALQDSFLSLLKSTEFAQISSQDIAAGAGVAKGSFYLHYPSKDAILHELAKDAISKLYVMGLEALEIGGSKAAALSNCRYVDENRPLWTALLTGGAQNVIREELRSLSLKVAEERGVADDRLPHDLSTTFANGATIDILAWWLRQEKLYSPEFVAEMMIELIFNSIKRVSTSPNLKF